MITLLYVDLFCGAGGTSSGVEKATINGEKCAEVIACINHDINAIKSHKANHKWHYLMNPQYQSAGGSIDAPCFTLIARMDKMPPYLIIAENGHWGIKLNDNDSEMTFKIKIFMALYNIVDIKMRMLKIIELLTIMGFPADYVLIGTKKDQKKYIGNAVEVNMSRVLCEATARTLHDKSQTA